MYLYRTRDPRPNRNGKTISVAGTDTKEAFRRNTSVQTQWSHLFSMFDETQHEVRVILGNRNVLPCRCRYLVEGNVSGSAED